MFGESALDGRGCDVLALRGFELLLHSTDDTDLIVGIHCDNVARMKESVAIETLARAVGIFVIADHVHGAADEEFAFGRDALFDARDGRPDIARADGNGI